MSNRYWIILVAIATILVHKASGLSFLEFFLVAIPLMVIVFTYASFLYSFRASLAPEPVPAGCRDRARAIERDEPELARLGFRRFDAFYLKIIPDSVIYAYRHESESVLLCVYHLGARKTCDLVSRFVNEYTVTTTPAIEGGMTPRPPRSFLQVLPEAGYVDLLEMHRKAVLFLAGRNLKPVEIKPEIFRDYFMKSIREFSAHVRAMPFWPVRLVWWTLSKRGRLHLRPIEKQVEDGFIAIR